MRKTFCNPVSFSDGKRHTNPDPFVLRWCGSYYCYATDEFGVKISVSQNLVDWEYLGYGISEKEYRHYWAPSVLYLDGKFYMYYSNIHISDEDCHKEHLKLAVADRPEGPFVYRKTFFDKFSIDSHPVIWNKEMYMLYSVNDWLGTEEKISGTCIMMDKMVSPEEFEGHPKPVVLPTRPQEIYAPDRFGDGRDWYTIEGACPVIRDGKCWMLYSANAYENVDYFVGTAVAKCKKNIKKMKWKKYPDKFTWVPLIRKNDLVEGTGHNTVTKAPNLVDDWIVYHGRSALEQLKPGVEQREMYIDPLYYSGRHMICLGPTAEKQKAPEASEKKFGRQEFTTKEMLCQGSMFYVMEIWSSAKKYHTGARYGIYVDYQDDRNYTEVQIYTGQKSIRAVCCRDGVREILKTKALPETYDYTVPHLLRIQRNFEKYEVKLDENLNFCFSMENRNNSEGKIGIIPYFSEVTLYSFCLTCHASLRKKSLRNLTYFYNISNALVEKKGLFSPNGKILLEEKYDRDDLYGKDKNYTEEFSVDVTASENRFCFSREENIMVNVQDKTGTYSVYHKVCDGTEQFLLDGIWSEPVRITENKSVKICMTGLRIMSYRYTKN